MSALTGDLGAWWVLAGVVLALAATVLRERHGGPVRVVGSRAERVAWWSIHGALLGVVLVLVVSTAARFATVL